MVTSLVLEQLRQLPDNPGVYIMKDPGGKIIYVGKASNLRSRLRSYFGSMDKLSPKTRQLVEHVADLEFYITVSEQEALILENNLIKMHHPRYNIQMRDDKSYPYIKVDLSDQWPRIYLTRHYEEDGGRYFGPFASAWSVRQTLKVLRGIFPFRSCSRLLEGKKTRACLEFHMGRCPAPCTGAVARSEYDAVIRGAVLFLEGKHDRVLRELKSRMNRASKAQEYERAAIFRDQVRAIERVIEGQRIAARVSGDQDIIAFAQERNQAFVQVFFIRHDRLTGRESFVLQGTRDEEPAQVMTSFVKQFYASNPNIPPLILLQHPIDDAALIRDWLRSKRRSAVAILVPMRGTRKELVDQVAENARQGLAQLRIRELAAPKSLDAALDEIKKELGLTTSPLRMEAYDISNVQGKSAVGSMVVFDHGKPKTAHYRRFRIKTVSGANDYAMIQEVLRRRFKRAAGADDSWAIMPDLVLIDGGKGQLNAGLATMRGAGVDVAVASLAKENEEIYLPQRESPVVLPRTSPGLQMLQRLRDEAHRFAIGYYARVHRKEMFTSRLDGVPGIGPKRKRALLKQFGNPDAIREAPVEAIAAAAGISVAQAGKVKSHL